MSNVSQSSTMMFPKSTTRQYVNSGDDNGNTNTMDGMSSLLFDALYQRSLQERRLSLQQQLHPTYYLQSNINQNPVPASISVDGRLFALVPIQGEHVIGTTAPTYNDSQSQYILRNSTVEQDRDDFNSSNRGNEYNAATAAAAAALVQSKHSNKTTRSASRKKVKDGRGVKHRPALHVPAKAFVAITEPSNNDVLLGRGGRINKHIGNVQLRDIVKSRQEEYMSSSTAKLDKAYISADIVASIRLQYHGRFLEEDPVDHTWYEVGDERAIRKVLQALRENSPTIRSSKEPPGTSSSDQQQEN